MSKINGKEKYVPKEDRVAVFDLDGTLFQETDPTYDDWKLFYYRVYNDSTFKPTEEQKQIADDILKSAKENVMPDDLNIRIAQTYTQLFNSMSLEEYQQYIRDFVSKPAEGYENLKRGDAFYKPMLELIEYLQKMILMFISQVEQTDIKYAQLLKAISIFQKATLLVLIMKSLQQIKEMKRDMNMNIGKMMNLNLMENFL